LEPRARLLSEETLEAMLLLRQGSGGRSRA
jgi:hypothetical protein